MKQTFILLMIFLQLILSEKNYAQTYTYNPSKANCSLKWTDGNCWDKVNISECTNNSPSLFPPLVNSANLPSFNTIQTNCEINVVINNNITLDPGYDFGFRGPNYNIHLYEKISFSTPRNLYLLETTNLRFINTSGTSDAFVNLKNIYHSTRSSFIIRDNITVEADNALHPTASSYERINYHIFPKSTFRVSNTMTLDQGNTGYITVEGIFEVKNLNIGAGDRQTLAKKNTLWIKGSGKSQVCSSLNISQDSYVNVEANGTLNSPVINLKNAALFDNRGKVNIKSVLITESSSIRLYSNSEFYNETITEDLKFSGKYYKCDKAVAKLSDPPPSGCTASYAKKSDQAFWAAVTEDLCARLLPITMIEERLEYNKANQVVSLFWTTSKEWENSHFEIERSVNGIDDFKKIGRMEGMGWSDEENSYRFDDKEIPMTGERMYYRIRQVDFNNDFSIGIVMTVLPLIKDQNFSNWVAYPNPTNGKNLSVNLGKHKHSDPIEFRIFNQFFTTEIFRVQREEDMNYLLNGLVNKLPEGMNFMEIRIGARMEVLKLICNKE